MAEVVELCRKCDELFMADGTKYCEVCKPTKEAKRRADNPHQHSAASRSRMRAVVRAAKANPNTVCHLCTRKFPPEGYDPVWTADHEKAGDAKSRLLPAHRGCNSARGNRSIEWFRAHVVKRWPDWVFLS